MSMTQNYSAHVAKVVASLPLFLSHECSKKKKKKYFLQKKNTVAQVVMNLDFVSSSDKPLSVTTLFKAIAKTY